MRYWVLAQRCIGVENPRAQDFTEEVMTEALAQMQVDKDYKESNSGHGYPEATKFNDLVKWTKFWEIFTTYLGRIRGAALTPLSSR
jgi:hypothetical protein